MLVAVLVIGGLILIAMVLRFVQPQLLYGLRRFLREVRTNKATLDYEAGRTVANREFVAALMRDGRPETEEATAGAARRRANKLRELYRILDPRNPLPDGVKRQEDPTVCIIELADLVRNLAEQMKPNLENNRPVVPSGSLLRYVGKMVREAEEEGGADLTEQDLGSWYIENPISMEQITEMLIAVVEAVSFRLQAEEEVATRVTRDYSTGDQIIRLERKLRALVRAKYLAKYPTSQPEERIKSILAPGDYQECTRRMEKARANGSVNVDFLDFLYYRQVEKLILTDWELFSPTLKDRDWFTTRVEKIIWARNEVSHSRELSRADEEVVKRFCQEIADRIGRPAGQ